MFYSGAMQAAARVAAEEEQQSESPAAEPVAPAPPSDQTDRMVEQSLTMEVLDDG